MQRQTFTTCAAALALTILGFTLPGTAFALPVGWTCTGNCGTLGANGVVTAPPGGTTYDWVSTSGGVLLGANDLNIGAETNGSLLRSTVFAADAGDPLQFHFNYITSDGTASFVEYAWARLLDDTLAPIADGLLFAARTNPTGNAVPGFGLPAANATLNPTSTPILHGQTTWSPLGGSSGACFGGVGAGCGQTGWIQSLYTIANSGNYVLEFGVVNWGDMALDSGFAFAGTTVGGTPIQDPVPPVPEPAALLLVGSGIAAALRRFRGRILA